MTTYSASDLATSIGQYLGLVGEDETPSSAFISKVSQIADSEIASMQNRGISIIGGSSAAIPLEYLMPLTIRLALPVGVSAGLYTAAQVAVGIIPAEMVLRQLNAKQPTGSVVEVEYL